MYEYPPLLQIQLFLSQDLGVLWFLPGSSDSYKHTVESRSGHLVSVKKLVRLITSLKSGGYFTGTHGKIEKNSGDIKEFLNI